MNSIIVEIPDSARREQGQQSSAGSRAGGICSSAEGCNARVDRMAMLQRVWRSLPRYYRSLAELFLQILRNGVVIIK